MNPKLPQKLNLRLFLGIQVLHQDETPRLYSLVFGEGVVNDATVVVLFNTIQHLDVSKLRGWTEFPLFGDFLYLFSTSTVLGVAVSIISQVILVHSCTMGFSPH